MNDAWYQVIYSLQQNVTIASIAFLVLMFAMIIFLIWTPKKRFYTEDDRLQYLMNDLKASKANADKIMHVYDNRIEDKKLEIKQHENRLKDVEAQIAEQENDLLLLTDIPEELLSKLNVSKRRHNYKMLLIGILVGSIISVGISFIITNLDKIRPVLGL